jgi:Ni/Co efflux regulator RcnB
MKTKLLTLIAVGAGLTLSICVAQNNRQRGGGQNQSSGAKFDDHAQQVTKDWYSQHRDRPPVGFRNQDRLSADQESRLREGSVLDSDLRRKVHPAPPDLARQLPEPPANHRYVAIGDHVGLVDNKHEVKALIHLHSER